MDTDDLCVCCGCGVYYDRDRTKKIMKSYYGETEQIIHVCPVCKNEQNNE